MNPKEKETLKKKYLDSVKACKKFPPVPYYNFQVMKLAGELLKNQVEI